ncbi:MAG: AMIN domain-containing protein [Blastocatellia bacterium]|nr:AMIN domain-containing protein [Blastocatellia bacterium]
MPRDYRVRVAVVLAMLLFMGTLNGTFAYETKAKSAVSLTTINSITTKTENGRVAAIIQADGQLSYKVFTLHSPERVVLDISGAVNAIKKDINTSSDKITNIRVGTQSTNDLRIVFDIKEKCSYQVQALNNGLAIYFTDFQPQIAKENTKSTVAKKSVAKEVIAPPVAPPDTTGLSAGREEKNNSTKASKEGEGRSSANLPSVKGPSIRPGISRSAAARPASSLNTTTTPTSTSNDTDPQGPKIRFGEPGFIGDPISIDIAGVDINDVLRFISDNYGENFILDKSVGQVNVTLKVNDVPWNQVVESIFKANQLSSIRENAIVRVATLTALAEEQAKQRAIEEEKINNLPKQTKFFRLKYIRLGSTGQISGAAGNLGGGQGGAVGSNLGSQGGNTAGIGATGLIGIILKSLSKVGQVDADFRTNQILVTDIPQNVAQIEDIIRKLDVPEPQVEIEARVVLANRSFSRTIGNQLALATTQTKTILNPDGSRKVIQGLGAIFQTSPQVINTPIRTDLAGGAGTANGNNLGSGGFIGPVANGTLAGAGASILSLTTGVIGTSLLSTAITASEQKGIAKTISNPRITVQNNTPADITSGTQIAVQTEVNNTITTTFITAALRLNVIPQIADEGNVLMRIVVENNSVDRSLRTTGGTPSISTQRAETLVLVPDGGTTILGGINIDTEASVSTRTPGVARVPFLGELFKRRQLDRNSQELLFFVTPRIYRPESFGAQANPPAPAQPAQPVAAPQAQPQVLPQGGGER